MGGKTNAQTPPHYSGIQLQTSAEGLCIPIVWGMARVAPNLIWTANFKLASGSSKKAGGGKGGGKSGGKKGSQPDYTAAVALALCEGPIQGIARVFKDQTVTDLPALRLMLYTGTATQAAFPAMPDGVRYPLTAYVASNDYDLGASATPPQHNFEVLGFRCGEIPGSADVGPANIIHDLLTSAQYGLAMPDDAIDDMTQYSDYCLAQGILLSPRLAQQEQAISLLQRWAQFTNSWIFWSENKIKFVPLGDSPLTALGIGPITSVIPGRIGENYSIGDIVTITGGSGDATIEITQVYSGGTDHAYGSVQTFFVISYGTAYSSATEAATSGGTGSGFTVGVYVSAGGSYTPNTTPVYDLTYDDFEASDGKPPVTVTRADPADCYNWVKVQITDRGNQYSSATMEFKDQNSIELYGLMQAQDIQATEICDRAIGTIVAAIVGKRAVNIRNTYSFKTSYNYVLLEPGDIITLTDPAIGLTRFPVRIQTMQEDQQGLLAFVAEECPEGIGTPAIYNAQAWAGVLPPVTTVEPGPVNAPVIVEPPASVTQGTALIWIGASGASQYWGGATVYASVDDVTYVSLGNVPGRTPQGQLRAVLASHADPDTADTLSVDLAESLTVLSSSVTDADADALRTVALVDSELIGYGAVVPNGAGAFDFDITYLRRGAYNTAIAAHAIGAPFAALTPTTMLQVPLPKAYVGQTIYLKFTSYNVFGGAIEDISTVARYEYVPTGVVYTIAPPGAVTLADTTGAGVTQTLTVTWSASAGPGLGSYEVAFSTDGGATWTGADVVTGAAATSYTLSPAQPITHYEARVRAISANGQAISAWVTSNIVVTGTAPVIPSGGVTALPLVNGDIPVGLMVDQFGALILVAQ